MATLEDAATLVKNDPPTAFVAIAVAGARPPNKGIIVKLKGQTLLLPDWGSEWLWYLKLAIAIANKQSTVGATALVNGKERARAIANDLVKRLGDGSNLDRLHPASDLAFEIYDAAVRLVLASNAASVGESRGSQALDAFTESLKEAPRTVLTALSGATAAVAQESGKILAEVFEATVKGIFSGAGVITLVALGLWLWSKHGKEG